MVSTSSGAGTMTERFPQLFWGLVAAAVAIVLAALVSGAAVRDLRRDDVVEVTGSARRPIRSDFAVWRVSATRQSGVLEEAFAGLNADAGRIRAFLRANGVADTLVRVNPVETEPVYRMLESGAITTDLMGYRLTQRIEVRSRDVNGITALTERANELITQGVPLVSAAPEYLFTGLDTLRAIMLEEAAADAKRRAEAIARSVGSDVGGVRSARMGVFQITPRNSTEVSDYGINDVTSIDKDITAVVRVSFAMD